MNELEKCNTYDCEKLGKFASIWSRKMNKLEKCNTYDLGNMYKEIPCDDVRMECYRRGEVVSIKMRKLENEIRLLKAEQNELWRVFNMKVSD